MAKIAFKRKIYNQMLEWKTSSNGRTALLINGARRVGKTTIAEEFAKQEYEAYLRIDFSNISKAVHKLFEDLSDIEFFFMQLQLQTNVSLPRRKSVIIFDEVQLQPLARQSIKHLVADGRYDYIETGLLVSIHKNVKNILIPSEEEQIEMFPMDYEEFSWALGNTTFPIVQQFYEMQKSLGDGVHRKMMRDFRLYMLVGGMPQAVSEYIESHDLLRVDKVKRNILDLYDDDFRKIDSTGRLSMLFRAIPAELNRNASRYVASNAVSGSRADRVLELIAEMVDSMTVNAAYHSNDPNVGFLLHQDITRYKLYIADTGLFVTLAFQDKAFTENILYKKLLDDKLNADLGYVYENVVAQMLRASGNKLYYYTFPKDTTHNYEIDFLISRGTKISPIEVKSSGYKTHASLDAFCEKFSSRVGNRYLVYTKDLRKDQNILCLPVYMTGLL